MKRPPRSTAEPTGEKRRVIVYIDESPLSATALLVAQHLAQALQLPLAGLLLEDADLVRYAGLPFAQLVAPTGAQSLDPQRLRSEFAHRRDRLRSWIETKLGASALAWSFNVQQGDLSAELATHARRENIVSLALGHAPTSLPPRSLLRRLMAESGPSLVVVCNENLGRDPVVLYVDDRSSVNTALAVGLALAQAEQTTLYVLLDSRTQLTADLLTPLLPPSTSAAIPSWRIVSLSPGENWLARSTQLARHGLIMLSRKSGRNHVEALETLMRHGDLSLFFVR